MSDDGEFSLHCGARTMLHSMKATKHSETIVHRRFQNGWLIAACAGESQDHHDIRVREVLPFVPQMI